MRLENAVAADVLERILSAYGFTMQKELSDKLGIAKSNVASWLQRGQVPGNVLVQCALDTGAEISWLVNGKLANANILTSRNSKKTRSLFGASLIKKVLESGGKPVLQRVMDAYGFKTQKEMGDYFGISTGTISTWVRREYFPGDIVIACALDTGADLEWLSVGVSDKDKCNICSVPKKNLRDGVLHSDGVWNVDTSFVPQPLKEPVLINGAQGTWITDYGYSDLSNGKWLIGIDKRYDIYDVILLPGKKITLISKILEFTCSIEEVEVLGKIMATIHYDV